MQPRLIRTILTGRLHDDRSSVEADVGYGALKPPILRRRTIHAIAILGIVAILYGTLLPFQMDSAKSFTWRLGLHSPASGDFIANILIYVPVGAFLCLLFRRRGSSTMLVGLLSLLVAGALAYLTEASQTVMAARIASWTDTLSNTLGAAIGIVFAPLFQRILRNVHVWLYVALRTRPFAAAAAASTLCIWIYALAPFDVHPTPGHVAHALRSLHDAKTLLPFGAGAGGDTPLSPNRALNKVVACASYGLLAFLLVLSAREAGGRQAASAWHAFSRTVGMASAIEMMQLFTVSHVTDPADLTGGWICAGLGTVMAWCATTIAPDLHRKPRRVLQWLAAIMILGVSLWKSAGLALMEGPGWHDQNSWLPMVNVFDCTWNSVLGDYTMGFLQYAMVGGILAIWCRSKHLRPPFWLIVAVTLLAASIGSAFILVAHKPLDTGELVLALLAGITVVGLDRALWDKKAKALTVATQ